MSKLRSKIQVLNGNFNLKVLAKVYAITFIVVFIGAFTLMGCKWLIHTFLSASIVHVALSAFEIGYLIAFGYVFIKVMGYVYKALMPKVIINPTKGSD